MGCCIIFATEEVLYIIHNKALLHSAKYITGTTCIMCMRGESMAFSKNPLINELFNIQFIQTNRNIFSCIYTSTHSHLNIISGK